MRCTTFTKFMNGSSSRNEALDQHLAWRYTHDLLYTTDRSFNDAVPSLPAHTHHLRDSYLENTVHFKNLDHRNQTLEKLSNEKLVSRVPENNDLRWQD